MLTLTDYQIVDTVNQNANSTVYRALRIHDQTPVILKVLNESYATPEAVAWFKREFNILRSFNLAGVVRAYELLNIQNHWLMVLEDFDGESLSKLGMQGKFSLLDFLKIAISITDILGKIHQHHIIHKNINLTNIVFNTETKTIKIIDFGIATILSRENPTFRNPNVLEGSLAYLSPEQTGRMNRAIDYRTDFYSLGVTLYELLSGERPFIATDPMALIHMHIAQMPAVLHHAHPHIPPMLSRIIMKLLAKNAEDRYQSASGLKHDLETCLHQLETNNDIAPFPLAQTDISDRFHIPEKLYQREQEVETLLHSFEAVCSGGSEMVLVSGHPGVGKTALIQEIYKPVTGQRGYFIAGKFDPFQRNIPYLSLIQAFTDLIHQHLTDSEEQIAYWRQKLQQALGNNGQVIVDVIPEVAFIIGQQPPVPELPALEAQNRFHLIFKQFVQVFTQPEHPLVLFLDNLQWADSGSLQLLESLLGQQESQYLFVIGAYRDNEVLEGHPLFITLKTITQAGQSIRYIHLKSLDLAHITQLIADTLYCSIETARPLATLVLSKTQGNPFFVNEFLKSLYQTQLLTFNYKNHQWEWHIKQIQAQDITENVVELMANKVQQLPSATQEVLQLAACMGNQIDLFTLSLVREKPQVMVATELRQAILTGLILPLGDGYKLAELDVDGLAESVDVTYKFAHDRIQQAIYNLFSSDQQQVIHLQIGRLLRKHIPQKKQESFLFDMVNQLNLGQLFMEDNQEREELAVLNLHAGKKAKSSTAYGPAFTYLQTGIQLLSAHSWQSNYPLTLDLYVNATETAYLNSQWETMRQLGNTVLEKAQNPIDKVLIYEVQLQAFKAQNKLLDVVNTGRVVLNLLGVDIPKNPDAQDITLAQEELASVLAEQKIQELFNHPPMTNPTNLAAMRVMNRMFSASFVAAPELIPILVAKQVYLSVKEGTAPESAFAYACHGLGLCGFNQIDIGYEFGQLALQLAKQVNTKEHQARPMEIVHAFITHWKENTRTTLLPLLDGYRIALETGDLEYAAYSSFVYAYHLYAVGDELHEVEQEMRKYSQVIGRLHQETVLHLTDLYHQVVLNLISADDNPHILSGEKYDETTLSLLQKANDIGTLCHVYLNKMVLHYLFGYFAEAVEFAGITQQHLGSIVSSVTYPVFFFYDSLCHLALYPEMPADKQKQFLIRVNENQQKMQEWATHAPINYQHKYLLVAAEQARVLGEIDTAMTRYDQAIDSAQEHKYLNELALALELASCFYQTIKRERIANLYLREAYFAYQHWGAIAKVQALEKQYPSLLRQGQLNQTLTTTSTITTTNVGQNVSAQLDLESVIKASQTISGEIQLKQLLAKLIQILLENAGAQRCLLVLIYKENSPIKQLLIEAEGDISQKKVEVLQSIPIHTRRMTPFETSELILSPEIVQYVSRTKKTVVLDNASQIGEFVHTDYMKEQQPKSIVSVPLIHHGKVIGILYLENNLSIAAFPPERVEMVRLLGTQAAISITNVQAIAARQEQERLQMENQFLEKQSQELAKLNAAKDKFFSIVAHDLRAPFNPILGLSQFMMMMADSSTVEEIVEMSEAIYRSAQATYNLLENLLTWSRLERGLLDCHPSIISAREIANRTVNLLTTVADTKDITLQETFDTHCLVLADEQMLDTIIRNLVSNAIKFTPRGGQVTITEKNTDDSMTTISVIDTGVGIPADQIHKIFQIKDNFSTKGTENEAGTGLGLSICQDMVRKNGGKIWLDSILDKGTTVSFTIPKAN